MLECSLNKLTETISAIQKAIHIHVSRVLKKLCDQLENNINNFMATQAMSNYASFPRTTA